MPSTTVKERPIVFSAPMVRAILDGRKTQTRRVVKPQPRVDWLGYIMIGPGVATLCGPDYPDGEDDEITCRFGVPGDRLWVRETWRPYSDDELFDSIRYEADGAILKPNIEDCNVGFRFSEDCDRWGKHGANRSPIHMPRWASRITLEITDVRVQRLREISEEDAIAEGSFLDRCPCLPRKNDKTSLDALFRQTGCHIHGLQFRELWHNLHKSDGPHGWNANPWLWAITFRRIEE